MLPPFDMHSGGYLLDVIYPLLLHTQHYLTLQWLKRAQLQASSAIIVAASEQLSSSYLHDPSLHHGVLHSPVC